MQPFLTRIEIQGFRSFGNSRQALDLPETVSVLWGGNSQGKTSFAEGIEFLFTGQIARRDLLASAKDEFTDALRNAHVDDTFPVIVEGYLKCADEKIRRLTRTLTEDYRRGSASGCVSRLEIDGNPCTEADIETQLGLRLSHAPLKAPVLAQHTLAYLFSTSPTERASYFRAILDTQDLEDFRAAVVALQPLQKPPELPRLADLVAIEAIPSVKPIVPQIRKAKTEAKLVEAIDACVSALLAALEITPAEDLAARVVQIEAEFTRRRLLAFPVSFFQRTALAPWVGPADTLAATITAFADERAKIDKEAQQLIDLFNAALSLPMELSDHDPRDCPLCGAQDTLTPERLRFIRGQAQATAAYVAASTALGTELAAIDAQLTALDRSVALAMPRFLREDGRARRRAGFRVSAIEQLVPDQELVRSWLASVRQFAKSARDLHRAILVARTEIETTVDKLDDWQNADGLTLLLANILAAQAIFELRLKEYEPLARALGDPLQVAVERSTHTEGWEALIRIGREPTVVWNSMLAAAGHALQVKTLEKALSEIETANGKVLDYKFTRLSKDVRYWWDRLRPDEPAFFDAIQRRGAKTKRTVDLKVGLSAKEDRSDAKFRDAIAVFSQSQIHCLGLSLFLARAVQEGAKFVVLDDPVLTSDDDYRPNFASSVIEGLLDAGIQVIIATQDHKTWKDIGHRWSQRGALQFQLVRNEPKIGSEIRGENDDLAAMLVRATPAAKSNDPILRKSGALQIRLAIERFGKMVLVRHRQANGDTTASITDYDGENFGNYNQKVYDLLNKDQSHPGKLRAAYAYVTSGPHDDGPPSSGDLKVALGDLKKFKKDYLD